MEITIPVSAGHLIDRITILEIKKTRIADRAKHNNVCRELDALTHIRETFSQLDAPAVRDIERQLFEANKLLWEIEDVLRSLEDRKDFGERFVAAARSVYLTNDKRAGLKRGNRPPSRERLWRGKVVLGSHARTPVKPLCMGERNSSAPAKA